VRSLDTTSIHCQVRECFESVVDITFAALIRFDSAILPAYPYLSPPRTPRQVEFKLDSSEINHT